MNSNSKIIPIFPDGHYSWTLSRWTLGKERDGEYAPLDYSINNSTKKYLDSQPQLRISTPKRPNLTNLGPTPTAGAQHPFFPRPLGRRSPGGSAGHGGHGAEEAAGSRAGR